MVVSYSVCKLGKLSSGAGGKYLSGGTDVSKEGADHVVGAIRSVPVNGKGREDKL